MQCCPNPRCSGKTVHASRSDADRAVKAQSNRGKIRTRKTTESPARIHAYRCPAGNGWHVGHTRVTEVRAHA